MPTKKSVRAREGFSVATVSGRPRRVARHEVFAANDPIVKAAPHLFEDLDEVVERATAAPGEKRTTKPRSKAKADAAKS